MNGDQSAWPEVEVAGYPADFPAEKLGKLHGMTGRIAGNGVEDMENGGGYTVSYALDTSGG